MNMPALHRNGHNPADKRHREEMDARLFRASAADLETLCQEFSSSWNGLDREGVEESRERCGANIVTHGKKDSLFKRLAKAFINPFTAILLFLAGVSVLTDIILADPGDEDYMTVIIIMTMVIISGLLRFIQETRSGNAAENLLKMIKTTTNVERMGMGRAEIPIEEVVVGDIVHLSAGDMIPADMRILVAKDMFISQASLTGESEPVEKVSTPLDRSADQSVTETANLAFMGTNVVSGAARGMVVAVGDDTVFGDTAKHMNVKPVQTSFEKGVNSVSWVLIRFMLVMVPIVFFTNAITKGDWLQALLFAISVAVGLTPEMLPMIVTTCLAKGAVAMSKEKTIIKNLNSIQNLGSINILCTDKTGTLTQDKVVLEYHLNIQGELDVRVLRHAFLNSYYQTGLKNLLDIAIINRTLEQQENDAALFFTKVDEIPFDFNRRRMSVVVQDIAGKTQMITKGAVEEMLAVCSHVEYGGEVIPLTQSMRAYVTEKVDRLNQDGLRVICVAQKNNPAPVGAFSIADESDMVLIGYLAFLDPPKESAAKAIRALLDHGVRVKVLTGDNDKVSRCVCRQVGINTDRIVLGSDLEEMTDAALAECLETTDIFAKLSPPQKARVIAVL
ncbi:MAG: magnesium-translocating P-type ATPase, partial [Planctomycetes bacterium]|nr:magnesium-translocating P-type ATPase [Planctomycetota bacterium]